MSADTMTGLRRFVRAYTSLAIALLYLMAAAVLRLAVPTTAGLYSVVVYALAAVTCLALIVLFFSQPASEIRVPAPPGALGDESLSQYAEHVEDLLTQQVRLLESLEQESRATQRQNDYLQATVESLTREIARLRRLQMESAQSAKQSQIWSIVVSIVATVLLSGVPGPFAALFPK